MVGPKEGQGQATDAPAPDATSSASSVEPTVAPPASSGQSEPSSEPTSSPAPAPAEESFFDPESIKGKPELESAYKEMQRAFTRRMEGFKGDQQAIDAYKAFQADPHGSLEKIATQLGYSLSQRQAAQAAQPGGNGQVDLENWQPNSWADVVNTIQQQTSKSIWENVQQRLEPFLGELKEVRKSTLEQQLDQNCPDWRQYEDQMMDLLQKHPTLVSNPVDLYRMALPSEVAESRATQRALAKLQKSTQTQPSGGSTTTRQTTDQPTGPKTFDDAVKWAKADLASKGVRGPWSQ